MTPPATRLRRLVALLLAPLVLGALLTVTSTPASAVGTDPVGEWPLQPRPEVVRGFDPPEVVWGSGHRGVDLLGTSGQAVHAALAGTITFAGALAGRGVVVVDHGATRTTYEPVTASVGVGDAVPQGAVLGTLATAGSHCLPRSCLHWGWKEGDTYLDPLRLVGAGPVRLLPLWRDEPLPVTARPFVGPYVALLATWFASGAWTPLVRAPPLRPAGAPAGRPVAAGPW
jgi:murein DD-endopeptidase MepM/ murein hydrolase activator NlpD